MHFVALCVDVRILCDKVFKIQEGIFWMTQSEKVQLSRLGIMSSNSHFEFAFREKV